jgi:hypothetical protein
MTSYRIVLSLFALISLAIAFDLAAIKPRFPQQFMATITHNNQDYHEKSYYGGQPYPCLFDFINKREKCGHRIRSFLNNTFTETNFTTSFPSKCNISSININNAKLLDPNWFDKLNLSLTTVSNGQYSWPFTLKKPTLLEELPFAPLSIVQQNPFGASNSRQVRIPFNKIRNIVGEIHTSDPEFTLPKSMSLSFDTPGYECPREYGDRDQSCRQNYSWTFIKQPSYAMIESGTVSVGDMFNILFTPCQNIDQQSAEQEEEDDN